MQLFVALGYTCIRSAASKGLFDFVALGAQDIACVQVKSTEWPRPAEIEALQLLRVPANVRKIVHRWRPRQRLPDVREV